MLLLRPSGRCGSECGSDAWAQTLDQRVSKSVDADDALSQMPSDGVLNVFRRRIVSYLESVFRELSAMILPSGMIL